MLKCQRWCLVCRRWQSDAFHLVEGISHPDEFSRDKMFWAKCPGSLRIGTILLFMPVSDVSDVSIGVWFDYFTFWEGEHQSLIAGCVLLRDPRSECLSGLRRISPIFGPIQMSKEPAMNIEQPLMEDHNIFWDLYKQAHLDLLNGADVSCQCNLEVSFLWKKIFAQNIALLSIYRDFSFLYPWIRKDGNIYRASPLSWWVSLFITPPTWSTTIIHKIHKCVQK